jgi:hypothetical protein
MSTWEFLKLGLEYLKWDIFDVLDFDRELTL